MGARSSRRGASRESCDGFLLSPAVAFAIAICVSLLEATIEPHPRLIGLGGVSMYASMPKINIPDGRCIDVFGDIEIPHAMIDPSY